MAGPAYALPPADFLRSIAASRDTLGRGRMRLLDLIGKVQELSSGAPYAVIGGLAQILWARKTHTDDLDIALAAEDLARCHGRVQRGDAGAGWSLPSAPDKAHEADDVFEVYHLLHDGAVVDLISFRDEAFNSAVITSARGVPELSGIRFITPELLLVTHLLRPGPLAAVAAVELVLARREHGGLDLTEVRSWAQRLGRSDRMDRTIERADAFSLE